MKHIVALLCVVIGCRSAPMGGVVGGASPRSAVEQLLAAANAQDLQAISAVFGDETGLARDRNPRDVTESRSFIMACVLKNDTQRLGDPQPAGNGRMLITADLTQGANSGSIRFEVAPGPNSRWFVANFDLSVLQNRGFCARP